MNYLVAGLVAILFAFFIASIKKVGGERLLLEEFAKRRGGKRLPGFAGSATHQPVVELPWNGHSIRVTNRGTGGQQSEYGTSIQLFTSFRPANEIQIAVVCKDWQTYPFSSLYKYSISEGSTLTDEYLIKSTNETSPLLSNILEAIAPSAIELAARGKYAILLKGTIVEVLKEGECTSIPALNELYEWVLPLFEAYLTVEENKRKELSAAASSTLIVAESALEPTIPKNAPKEVFVEKKRYALREEVLSWPYLSPFRSFLATVVMGTFMVFAISLLAVLLGQFGTVPFWFPFIFLALMLIAAGLHSKWRCFVEINLKSREVIYVVGNRESLLCAIDDINFIAVDGRRKEQAAGEWWWEYAVVIITWNGKVIPIVAPVMEELKETNNNARAIAAHLNLPLIEGKKRCMLKVEPDESEGRLSISFEEKQFEMYDAWPDVGSFSLSTPRDRHHQHRVIE